MSDHNRNVEFSSVQRTPLTSNLENALIFRLAQAKSLSEDLKTSILSQSDDYGAKYCDTRGGGLALSNLIVPQRNAQTQASFFVNSSHQLTMTWEAPKCLDHHSRRTRFIFSNF